MSKHYPKTLYIQDYSFAHLEWDTYRHNDDDIEYVLATRYAELERKLHEYTKLADLLEEQRHELMAENTRLRELLRECTRLPLSAEICD